MDRIQNKFWNEIASSVSLTDPFYLEKLTPYLQTDSQIIEYGCGYGRVLNHLHINNYTNVLGFDLSPGMINRGKEQFPHLNLQTINHAKIPLKEHAVDAVILSTVLCCIPSNEAQEQIIQEIKRILKPQGILYLTDFLITDTLLMKQRYQTDFQTYYEWGAHRTKEGFYIRHHYPEYITYLFNGFTLKWYEEANYFNMADYPVKTFHGIYQLSL